ncbi:abortive infection family protein [Amycolatopsis sp. NBC_01307]|uniref:abortive infection family protein n=1 Tax=Amycolatopsis sp. NBC_01307 TaxID=2903561 RepID=UPI002E0FDAF9|nr:abortive infection family protein [Amycolatopsis sp. NBC_01307]
MGLHPSARTPGPDGSDAVKEILGSVTGVAIGVAELRNRYGTGHGVAGPRTGLSTRHAYLAVNAAFTWCRLMLDTPADENEGARTAGDEHTSISTGPTSLSTTNPPSRPRPLLRVGVPAGRRSRSPG